ncbi:MAG: hypothetical protein ACF8NJ_01020 [Phycisphaerales bacterium JB038]
MRTRRALLLGAFAAAAMLLGGCKSAYFPGGNFRSANTFTYISTTSAPKTITLLDTRSGEEIWSVDVPVGHQLTMSFRDGEGDDPVYLPDLMQYRISPERFYFGRLDSQISVPNENSRRVVMTLRPSPEYPPAKE